MPKNPPPSVPIVSFPTPQTSDRMLVAIESTETADYAPIEPGTPHKDIAKYPGFVFVSQQPADDDSWVRRVWVNERAAQDSYNAAKVEYSGESENHPIYIRQYLERRGYSTRCRGKALTGIVFVKVVTGGSGYATPPVVSFPGGTGEGAAAFAVIFRGAVVGIVLTAEGTGYTDSQDVTLTGGGGTGATAFAQIQPVNALLIKEEESRLEGPLDGLYVNVTRTYYSLPGPYLPFTRWDLLLGPVQGRRRAVLNTGQAPSLGATGKITYEAMDGSSIVSWEIEEVWSDGTDSEGNPAYPIRVDDDYDDLKGPLEITSQVVVATGTEEGSIVLDPGVSITETTYRAINQFLLDRRVEVFLLPAPELTEPDTDKETGAATNTYRQIRPVGDTLRAEGSLYNTQIVIACRLEGRNEVYGVLVTETMALPPNRTERASRGFQFPARFDLLNVLWDIPKPPGYFSSGPFPGVHYTLTAHRSTNRPAECLFSYTNGPDPDPMPDEFTVTSPGAASRIFPIGQNTVHDAIVIYEYNPAPLLIENLPASTPASYDPTDELVIECSERRWNGPIWERRIFTVQETPP